MNYVGFTNRHLFQRMNEHTNSRFSIGKHMRLQHGANEQPLQKIRLDPREVIH